MMTMLNRIGGTNKHLWTALVVALLAVLTTVAAAASRPSFSRDNLSESDDRSKNPDTAAASSGRWVATAWVEENSGIVSLDGDGDETIKVFSAGASEQVHDVALALTAEGDVHVVYVVSDSGTRTFDIRYTTCDLSTGNACADGPAVTAPEAGRVMTVDLASGGNGVLHAVWARAGSVRHASYDGSAWSADQEVDASGMDSEDPAVACADGTVHVVWEDRLDGEIWYRRRSSETWTEGRVKLGTLESYGPAGNPDVAAENGRVFAVWDWCTDASCEAYFLFYARSNDNGASWDPRREVGTDFVSDADDSFTVYDSTFTDHRAHLQPAVALSQEGWPTVVWHASSGGDYEIHYSYRLSGGEHNVEWSDQNATLNSDQEVASAAVEAGGQTSDGEPCLRVAHMGKADDVYWDVYYTHNCEPWTSTYLPLVIRD